VALAEPSFSQELSYQENIDYDGDGDVDEEDLARAAQNPVADLISLPFQNNTIFGFGPFDRTGNLLNIQPVIPANLSSKVNLISRAILPVVTAPDVTRPEGTTWGLGDLVYTAFFSPAKPSALIWGAGPVLQIPEVGSWPVVGPTRYAGADGPRSPGEQHLVLRGKLGPC
jgi:hypothetical protein